MQICPYIFFNGQARDALAFYADVFDAPMPEVMTMAGAPEGMDIPEDRKDWIMHAMLDIGGQTVMMSDDFMANSEPMAGCSIQVNVPTAKEGQRIFERLSDGGEVRMKWEPTFWSAGFGALTDRFGIRWMVGCDEPSRG